MSFFGKNIKKIRNIKNLSQQSFADLFSLKRGTLGAYEEGRSEPRIETIITIANYFSITIDELLTRELTVNQLLQFKGDVVTEPSYIKKESYANIPCINNSNESDYVKNFSKTRFVEEMPVLQLPLNTEKVFRGYTVSNLEMTTHDKGFFPKDIVIGEKVPNSVIEKLNTGTLVFAVVNEAVIFRRLYISNKIAVLRADHKSIEDNQFELSEIKELWRVRYTFFRRIPELSNGIEKRFDFIEGKLKEINELLK